MAEKLTLVVFDGLTGQEIIRELTPEEVEEREAFVPSQSLDEMIEAKRTARESALAKLAALGLTEEEIAAL